MNPILAHGEVAFVVIIFWAIVMLVILAALLIGWVLLGLVLGGLVLAAVKRKRHLFWALPVINVALYLLVPSVMLRDIRPAPALTWTWAVFGNAWLGIPIVAFCGWISALLLAPFQM